MNDHAANLQETKGVNTAMQGVQQDIQEVEDTITLATYLASLHEAEKQIVLWRTLALVLLSFFLFFVLLLSIMILTL